MKRVGSATRHDSVLPNQEQLGSFSFNALPSFWGVASPAIVPTVQKKPRYWACGASPPPPLNDETSLADADRQDSTLRTWLVAFVRRIQGRCGAPKGVMKDVLSRGVAEVLKESGGVGNGDSLLLYRTPLQLAPCPDRCHTSTTVFPREKKKGRWI